MSKKLYSEDIIGLKYGMLTIVEDLGNTGSVRNIMVKCDCGTVKKSTLGPVKSGNIISCGCLTKERMSKLNLKHGKKRHPLYRSWRGMKERCLNPNSKDYANYGGRGVSVSLRWVDDFQSFYDWAISTGGWKPGLQLDKDIRSGGKRGDLYCPECCCFVTSKKNNNKRANTIYLTHNGVEKTLLEWSDDLNINYNTISARYYKGWISERILNKSGTSEKELVA